VLSDIPAQIDDRVLIDFRTSDDAGVFAWEGGPAIVQTVDFFTPIVDDPYTYGEIAAANALSDIYAMGGRPLTALAIGAFPKDGLDRDVIRLIFRGGFDMLREAGVSLLGGHTVQDPEIKFGYAVTGSIDAARIISNGGAKPGDLLFLTKPLGTGVVGTAIKFDRAPSTLVAEAVCSMRTLNRGAAAAMLSLPAGAVHACTDITGFGLLGHASEMAVASGVALVVEASEVPLFAGVLDIVALNKSGGMSSNREHFSGGVRIASAGPGSSSHRATSEDLESVLYDPQTSGGLLIAVGERDGGALSDALVRAGVHAGRVGRVQQKTSDALVIVV
jgi:selenide, water dikinase